MEWVETTGRTVEEAKDSALDQLGVDEQDAEFDVLEEPKTGLFGRLRSEARVRARVRPARPRPKEDRRERRRRRSSNEAGRDEKPQPAPAAKPRTKGPAGGNQAPQGDEGTEMEHDVSLGEQAELGRDFLAGLLRELGAVGTVELREVDRDTMELGVDGQDLGVLIGPKGATLNALQELTRTVVQRKTGGRNGRLVVDVSGYRQKRKEALERFTRQIAAEVKQTGAPRVLEPMHPADRKVVHDTVNEIEGVGTVSEGEEPRRHVVISPA